MFDLDHFRYYVGNPSAWDSYDDKMSDRMRAAADEIERLQARLNATPTPEAILLQARKPDGGPWIDIFPAQLGWLAKEGNEVRALDAPVTSGKLEAP